MEDLQSLLEKINRDGVEKAENEAAKIIAAAKAKADSIVKEALEKAEQYRSEAEKSAEDYASRGRESVKQAARDTILKVESSIVKLLEKILLKEVDNALENEETALALVKEAVKGVAGGEITCAGKLAASLAAKLKEQGSFTVSMDDTFGSGFSVKIDGGRIESAFTADVIAAELSKRLRSDLAKLVSAEK